MHRGHGLRFIFLVFLAFSSFLGCEPPVTDPCQGVSCKAGEVCKEGKCVSSCKAGELFCASACVDPKSNTQHCGACGTVCGRSQVCREGMCTLECPTNLTACDGTCVDTQSNPLFCGACDRNR